jgi:hypothetical protein
MGSKSYRQCNAVPTAKMTLVRSPPNLKTLTITVQIPGREKPNVMVFKRK